jgi:hypothetical protein
MSDRTQLQLIQNVKTRLLTFFKSLGLNNGYDEFYGLMKKCVKLFWTWTTNYRDYTDEYWEIIQGSPMEKDVEKIKYKLIPWIGEAKQTTGWATHEPAFKALCEFIESNFADDRIDSEKLLQQQPRTVTPQTPALTAELQAKFNQIEQRLTTLESKVNAAAKKSSRWGWRNSSHIDTLLEKMNDYNTDV